MRVISGRYGGRRLQTPKGGDIRPTSDKIRGSIFNSLNGMGVLDGGIVLDAFCGTGAMGIEALSRGAGHCTFVDLNKKSLGLAKDNVAMVGAEDDSDFVLQDSTKLDLQGQQFSLVFLDPPYGKNLIPRCLENLVAQDLLRENATVCCEFDKREDITFPDGFTVLSEKIYGDTKIVFLRLNNA